MKLNKLTEDLYASLKQLEWAGNDANGKGSYCHGCRGYRSDGHKDECHVNLALSQYALVAKAKELLGTA